MLSKQVKERIAENAERRFRSRTIEGRFMLAMHKRQERVLAARQARRKLIGEEAYAEEHQARLQASLEWMQRNGQYGAHAALSPLYNAPDPDAAQRGLHPADGKVSEHLWVDRDTKGIVGTNASGEVLMANGETAVEFYPHVMKESQDDEPKESASDDEETR